MVGVKSQDVKVKSSHKYIEVKLQPNDVALEELVVTAKHITDKIQPEPTDIEVRGNYFHVKTRVRVPREMFSHNNRLVVQPVIYNVTRHEEQLMRPMVYDARTYNRTQDRLYDYRMDDPQGDPLAQYVVVKTKEKREKGRTNDIIGYADSAYVEHVKDDYTCNVYMAIENYNRIVYRDTTIIAKGTINPLRWLDYSFAASQLNDSAYWPKPEVQLRDSKGEVNLRFPMNKAAFDPNDPNNIAEIGKMREQIEQISADKDATLQSLTINGTSSPDGRYNSNLQLAKKRMDYAVNYLRGLVPERARRGMKFASNAAVAPWGKVADLLRADSLYDEARQVESITKRWGNIDDQSRGMRKLPFYRSLLMDKYLPRLRHVGYVMNYSVFRQLTLDEIRQLYAADYKQLTKYEYFRLYRAEADSVRRETMLRQALEIYPSFMVAANDLSALLINRQAADADLLPGPRCPPGRVLALRLRSRQRDHAHAAGRERRAQRPVRRLLRNGGQDRTTQRARDAAGHEAQRRSAQTEQAAARRPSPDPLSEGHLPEPSGGSVGRLRRVAQGARHGPVAQAGGTRRRRRERFVARQ